MPAEDSDFWNYPEYCFFRPVGLCEHPENRGNGACNKRYCPFEVA